jgi:hypothetical protein
MGPVNTPRGEEMHMLLAASMQQACMLIDGALQLLTGDAPRAAPPEDVARLPLAAKPRTLKSLPP